MNGRMDQRKIRVDPLSVSSLLLEPARDNKTLGRATGFIVELAGRPYLITNRHVVECTDKETGDPANEIDIFYHAARGLYDWERRKEPLYSNGTHLWVEHPIDKSFDVIALPLQSVDCDILIRPFDLSLANSNIDACPSMPVSVIGFPLGLTMAGGWPIWKTGHIATDPDLDYNQKPVFLIDATTRGGMSGSPVVLRQFGGYNTRDGGYSLSPGVHTRFMGIYSGRIHKDSEIGMVWPPHVISEILGSIADACKG